jgi:hypothetical protein
LPLIVLTVLFHVLGILVIGKRAARASSHRIPWLNPTALFW